MGLGLRFASAFALGLRTLRGAVDEVALRGVGRGRRLLQERMAGPHAAAAEAACLAGWPPRALGWEGLVAAMGPASWGATRGPGLSRPRPSTCPPPPPPPAPGGSGAGASQGGAAKGPRAAAAWVSQRAQRAQQATSALVAAAAQRRPGPTSCAATWRPLRAQHGAACQTRTPRGRRLARGTASPARAEPLEPTAALADLSLRDGRWRRMDPRGGTLDSPPRLGGQGKPWRPRHRRRLAALILRRLCLRRGSGKRCLARRREWCFARRCRSSLDPRAAASAAGELERRGNGPAAAPALRDPARPKSSQDHVPKLRTTA